MAPSKQHPCRTKYHLRAAPVEDPGRWPSQLEISPAGKPYKSFQPMPHRSGQLCKKIRGKTFYCGKGDDPDAALKRYHEHCRDLHLGKGDAG